MSVASPVVMVLRWRRVTLGALAAVYLVGAGFLAGIAAERVRVDRERVAVIRAQAQRQREARERAIRLELQHSIGRAAPWSR